MTVLSRIEGPRFILCASLVIASAALNESVAEGVNLAALSDWDIVVPGDAIPSEAYAAQELREHLERATGVDLPISTSSARADRHIFVGSSELMRRSKVGFKTDDMGDEELRIVIRSGNIAIAGGRPRGTLYGVYTFLEDYVGVRFLTPEHTHVPPIGEWRVVGPVDRTYRPPLAFRYSYYAEVNGNPAFAARMRCNTVPTAPRFGGITPRRLINHSFASQIPSTRYGKEHPGVLQPRRRQAPLPSAQRLARQRAVPHEPGRLEDRNTSCSGRAQVEPEESQRLGQPE